MTTKEFEAFCRNIARPVIKFNHGVIDKEELVETLFVALGEEVVEETEKLIKKYGKKQP